MTARELSTLSQHQGAAELLYSDAIGADGYLANPQSTISSQPRLTVAHTRQAVVGLTSYGGNMTSVTGIIDILNDGTGQIIEQCRKIIW